jgi:Fe2+ transport system protein B
MSKHILFIGKIIVVFIVSTGFLGSDDTIVKEKVDIDNSVLSVKKNNDKTDADSLLTIATKDVIQYNKSEQAKYVSNLKLLESNKKILEYEKQESKLIKEVINKLKDDSKKEGIEENEVTTKIDSICSKYKSSLFGKKKCIEYTSIYTIIKDGKEIKLKEIK